MQEPHGKGQGMGHADYCQVVGQVTLDFYRQVASLRRDVEGASAFLKTLGEENAALKSELQAARTENAVLRSRGAPDGAG